MLGGGNYRPCSSRRQSRPNSSHRSSKAPSPMASSKGPSPMASRVSVDSGAEDRPVSLNDIMKNRLELDNFKVGNSDIYIT